MSATTGTIKASGATRRKILEAAFAEFYRNGFQGGSLNHIVEAAGTTKGALFHHFDGKLQLGYAVVDEIIGPLLRERWLRPLVGSDDPITTVQECFRHFVNLDIQSGSWLQGCPLNNLAQEMSPLDGGFRARINALYDEWREQLALSLATGIRAGAVHSDVASGQAAALVVAAQMGIWGSGKSSQREGVMQQTTEAICEYLESLRP